jgi:outer membrane protein assembly factor BamD
MNISRIISIVVYIFFIASCSSKKPEGEVQTVDQMYNEGIEKLGKKDYDKSIEKFEELERTYPYSKWATKAEIMSAYSSYKDEKYDDSIATLDRFIKLHPGNSDIEYAYYLKALSYYEQISDVTKDQSYSEYAKTSLQEVVSRFPNTRYANDCKLKLDLVNDHLAGKEVEVGRFYLKQGNTLAGINRFQKVIQNYDTTAHVPEALHRLVEAYVSLGVKAEAIKYASVLGYNFPESKWYERSYRLLEGKKPEAQSAEVAEDKWYNYKSWKGMIFKPAEAAENDGVTDRDLIDGIDRTVDEHNLSDPSSIEIAPKGEGFHPIKKMKSWFSGLKMPFTK